METIHGLSINGPAIIATAIVFTLLAVAAVALRFFSKRIAGSIYRWDDWLLLIALIIYVTTEVLVIICE